ncbi:Dom-3 Z [Mortierella claussenii]|nr:Dom-3 Z [Mortierella claussenii]
MSGLPPSHDPSESGDRTVPAGPHEPRKEQQPYHQPNHRSNEHSRHANDRRGGSHIEQRYRGNDRRGYYPHQHHHQQQQHGYPMRPQPPIRLAPGQPPPFAVPPGLMPQLQQQQQQQRQQHHQGHHPRHSHQSRHHHHAPIQARSESQFIVQPLDRFKVKCAPFRQPVEIGSFSYDEQRNFLMDDSQLKYYFPPDLTKPNNLSVNYDKYITRDLMVDEHIDALLDALICIRDREGQKKQEQEQEKEQQQEQEQEQEQEQQLNQKEQDEKSAAAATDLTLADFVCYRGILTKIMCTPYTRNEPWELGATLYKGSIYIEEHVTPEKRANAAGYNERHKLMSYWGYRFETICNISKPLSELRRIKTLKRRLPSASTAAAAASLKSLQVMHDGTITSGKDDAHSNSRKTPRLDEDELVELISESDHDKLGSSNTRDNNNDADDDDKLVEDIDLQDPELTGRLDGIVDTNLQYCTVARTRIGRNSIIMGAEVDCTSEPKDLSLHNPLSNYIELKTSRVISSAREQNNFESVSDHIIIIYIFGKRHKLLKFWAQSFLPGIPTIIVGFRDDDGNVLTVETFKTMEIPRLVRGKEGAWDTTVCINFLDGVLNFLRKIVVIDDPETTYTIKWAPPFKAIEVECAGKQNAFLTERFLDRWRNV